MTHATHSQGGTALHISSSSGKRESVELLLNNTYYVKANIAAVDEVFTDTYTHGGFYFIHTFILYTHGEYCDMLNLVNVISNRNCGFYVIHTWRIFYHTHRANVLLYMWQYHGIHAWRILCCRHMVNVLLYTTYTHGEY